MLFLFSFITIEFICWICCKDTWYVLTLLFFVGWILNQPLEMQFKPSQQGYIYLWNCTKKTETELKWNFSVIFFNILSSNQIPISRSLTKYTVKSVRGKGNIIFFNLKANLNKFFQGKLLCSPQKHHTSQWDP